MDRAFAAIAAQAIAEHVRRALATPQKTYALFADLAPRLKKERLLARAFAEIDGLCLLSAAQNIAITQKKLIERLCGDYSIREAEAVWIVDVFGAALGINMPQLPQAHRDEGITQAPHALAAIGRGHAAAVCADGSVVSDGANDVYQCDTHAWRNITGVCAGATHTLAIDADGTVFAAGQNLSGQCTVNGASGIANIFAYENTSVCITRSGKVFAVGARQMDLTEFCEIIGVAFYPNGLAGVRDDGSVVVCGEDADCEEAQWLASQRNVAQVAATYASGILVLTKDGRLYKSRQAPAYFAQWRDIVQICSLSDCFAALGRDGRVRVINPTLSEPRPQTDADNWQDICAIYGGYRRLLGLDRDGILHTATSNPAWLASNPGMSLDFVHGWPQIKSAAHTPARFHIFGRHK